MTARKPATARLSPKKDKPKLRLKRQTLRDLEFARKDPKGGACSHHSSDIT
jgi:hypothetical protein